MTPLAIVVLFLAGAIGGALNAVAGGGSFVVFPTMLLFTPIGEVAANATNTVALWPAGIASAVPYREYLAKLDKKTFGVFCVMSIIGGGVGAKLLLVTSDNTFAKLLPLLMLLAASVFTFGPAITKRAQARGRGHLPLAVGAVLQLVLATYGGYFGGGMGIMMLAVWTLMGFTHLHEMNAMKVVIALIVNGVAMAAFLIDGKASLLVALPVAIGSITGGYFGAAVAKKLDPKKLREVVLTIAWSLVAWFFYRALRK